MKINIDKLNLVLKYPEMIEAIADVLQHGIDKGYEDEGWLKPEGKTMSRSENFDHKNHHAAKTYVGDLYDKDSGLLHAAHEGTRSLMELVRIKRGIVHPNDDIKVARYNTIKEIASRQEFYDDIADFLAQEDKHAQEISSLPANLVNKANKLVEGVEVDLEKALHKHAESYACKEGKCRCAKTPNCS